MGGHVVKFAKSRSLVQLPGVRPDKRKGILPGLMSHVTSAPIHLLVGGGVYVHDGWPPSIIFTVSSGWCMMFMWPQNPKRPHFIKSSSTEFHCDQKPNEQSAWYQGSPAASWQNVQWLCLVWSCTVRVPSRNNLKAFGGTTEPRFKGPWLKCSRQQNTSKHNTEHSHTSHLFTMEREYALILCNDLQALPMRMHTILKKWDLQRDRIILTVEPKSITKGRNYVTRNKVLRILQERNRRAFPTK